MEITILSILVRVSVMYVAALAIIRFSGKQTVSELSTMDFVVVTILGDALDSVIFSEVTLLEAMVYFIVIAAWHTLTRFAASRSTFMYRLMASPARVMIQNGALVRENLRAERMRVEIVLGEMRLKGEDRLEEVKQAWLEENGKLSVLQKEPARPIQKNDLKSKKRQSP